MSYNTTQKKCIVNFLKKNKDTQYTIEEIFNNISKDTKEDILGKSTIYRIMTKLVDEGIVKRFVKGQSRQFVYQIVGCQDYNTHIHLKCIICGELLHLSCDVTNSIVNLIDNTYDFSINKNETVLFGICSKCR